MREGAHDIGFAFDGDGDRVLAVDASGKVHDGDELIALAARGLASRGELGGGVVVTVMTNFGFHQAMKEDGIDVAITQVGDNHTVGVEQQAMSFFGSRYVTPVTVVQY